MKLTAAFAQTLAVQVVQSAASIATAALIARALGPVGQGVYASLIATVALVAVVGTLGQFQGNVLVGAGGATSPRLLLTVALSQAALVLAVALITRPLWAPLVSHETFLALLFAAVLCAEVLAQLLRGINLGRRHIIAFNLVTFCQRFLLLGAVGAASLAKIRLTVAAVVACWLAAVGLSALVSAIWIWRRSEPVRLSLQRTAAAWWQVVGHGGRPLVVVVLTLLLVRLDVWMIRPMLGAASVGQLSVANGLAEWLWYVPSILNNLLFAAVAADPRGKALGKVAQASRFIAAGTLPASIALFLGGRALVTAIYGQQFAPAGSLFVVLVPGVAALALHLVIDAYFAGSGFPPVTLWTAAGALAAKFALNLVLVPALGIIGAAFSTSVVYVGMLVVKVVALRSARGVAVRDLFILRRSDISSVLVSARGWAVARGHNSASTAG